ncbi:MAG: AMP-binding protein, partial [Holophagae bacterium]|nr:AMP-binding protein [Holophagae bacterium]
MNRLSYAVGHSDVPLIGLTLGEMLDRVAARYPESDAVVSVHQDIRWTYKEFSGRVDHAARALMAMGVSKGDRVGIWAMNYAEWILIQFATAKMGAIMVNLNPAYRTHEFEYAMRQAEIHTLFVQKRFKTSDYMKMFQAVVPEAAGSSKGGIRSEHFPFLRNVVFMGEEQFDAVFSWSEFWDKAELISADELREAEYSLDFDDPINIQYTSGTTGYPKGVILTHHGLINNGYIIGEGMKFSEEDRLCIPVPFFHCFGMVLANIACITHGWAMVLPFPSFNAKAVLEAVQREKCTALHGVPTMFIAELAHSGFDTYDLSSLRTGIMAGSPCPVEVMKEVSKRMHMNEIVIVYGQTETSPGVTMTTTDDPLERRVSTVGRPFPHCEIKIIDPVNNRILPRGDTGEICARGYMVMKGYYNNPSATSQTLDENGWNHTGDLGVMDNEDYLRIVGRTRDVVIRGGENIYPREIEEFFHQQPEIADAYIIGVPDKKYGEELMLWVKLAEGINKGEVKIREMCRGKIAHYKIPRYVKFTDSFPMTISGKIQKFKMRQISVKELGLEDLERIETA